MLLSTDLSSNTVRFFIISGTMFFTSNSIFWLRLRYLNLGCLRSGQLANLLNDKSRTCKYGRDSNDFSVDSCHMEGQPKLMAKLLNLIIEDTFKLGRSHLRARWARSQGLVLKRASHLEDLPLNKNKWEKKNEKRSGKTIRKIRKEKRERKKIETDRFKTR